jgi:hypothetical protein
MILDLQRTYWNALSLWLVPYVVALPIDGGLQPPHHGLYI